MYFILFQNTDSLEHMPLIGPFTEKDNAQFYLDQFISIMDEKDEFTAVYGGEVVESIMFAGAVDRYIELMPGFGEHSS